MVREKTAAEATKKAACAGLSMLLACALMSFVLPAASDLAYANDNGSNVAVADVSRATTVPATWYRLNDDNSTSPSAAMHRFFGDNLSYEKNNDGTYTVYLTATGVSSFDFTVEVDGGAVEHTVSGDSWIYALTVSDISDAIAVTIKYTAGPMGTMSHNVLVFATLDTRVEWRDIADDGSESTSIVMPRLAGNAVSYTKHPEGFYNVDIAVSGGTGEDATDLGPDGIAFALAFGGEGVEPVINAEANTYIYTVSVGNITDPFDFSISYMTDAVPNTRNIRAYLDFTDKDALNARISAAEAALASAAVSKNGSDVDANAQWVAGSAAAALSEAIIQARQVATSGSVTQDEVDSATSALAKAISAFNDAKRPGTKSASSPDGKTTTSAVKTVTANTKTVTAKSLAAAVKAAGGDIKTVTSITLGSKAKTVKASAFKAFPKLKTVTLGKNVKTIKKGAFKGSKVKTVVVKTKKLTKKSVKGSLKGSKVKTVKVKVGKAKANKKYVKKYKKIFTKANAGKKAKVK